MAIVEQFSLKYEPSCKFSRLELLIITIAIVIRYYYVVLILGQRTEFCNAVREGWVGSYHPLVTQLSDLIETQFWCLPRCFRRYAFQWQQLETLSDETGSQKSNMMAEKTKLNVAQFLYTIATKFQRLYPCFRGRVTRRNYPEDCQMCG